MNPTKKRSEHFSRSRLIGAGLGAVGGVFLGWMLVGSNEAQPQASVLLTAVAIYAAVIVYLLMPLLTQAAKSLNFYLEVSTPQQVVIAGLGAAGGLGLAALAGWQLQTLPYGKPVTFVGAASLAWLGWRLGDSWGRRITLGAIEHNKSQRWMSILDSSMAIDDRLIDLARTGILGEALVVTTAVTKELQRMADLGDVEKIMKGRKGLDALANLRNERGIEVVFRETPNAVGAVDDLLLKLAREMDAPLVSTDYTLTQRARAEGLRIINVNEIAVALKPKLAPESEILITIVKRGTSEDQGVGYLDDGTMVVVDGAASQVGNQVKATINSVLQQVSGRMVFARVSGTKAGRHTR